MNKEKKKIVLVYMNPGQSLVIYLVETRVRLFQAKLTP